MYCAVVLYGKWTTNSLFCLTDSYARGEGGGRGEGEGEKVNHGIKAIVPNPFRIDDLAFFRLE